MTSLVKIIVPFSASLIKEKHLRFMGEHEGHMIYDHYAPEGNLFVRKGAEFGVTSFNDVVALKEAITNALLTKGN